MSRDCNMLSCTDCDYNTRWKCNLLRHMVRKHPQQNVNMPQQNVNMLQQNVNMPQQNVNMLQQNVNMLQQNVNICPNVINADDYVCDCTKKFKKKWILDRHVKTCSGVADCLVCPNCIKTFSSRQSKSIHMKKCTIKINNSEIQPIQNIQNITNNTNNNITNNTINNNNNNTININIVTYKSDQTELLPIQSKYIEKIKQRIKHATGKSPKALMAIINQYADYSLDVPNNRYIVKKNLRSPYSKVHCGNNNWRHLMDAKILPEFTDILLNDLQLLCDKNKLMYDYLDDLCSRVDDGKEDDTNKNYSKILHDIKLKIYDLTKDINTADLIANAQVMQSSHT